MSYVDVYRMWFTNDKGDDVIIHISDTASGAGTTTFHDMQDTDGKELIMSAKLSSANDGENKNSIVRSTRFTCEFLSTDTYNVDFFVQGEDNRWLVQVYVKDTTGNPIFTGYNVPEGAKEIFLDHGLYGVELTFSDLLQSIGETPLRNGTSVPKGKYTLIELVSWCLQRTFLQLPINVVYNLRDEHHTGTDDNFFRRIYEEALSFETDINEREDCLTVLRKILLGCFITQVNSEWWIIRVDEMDNNVYRVASFTYDAVFLSEAVSSNSYVKLIGLGNTINIVNEDAAIFPERQDGMDRQEFRFETWQEIICNINYTRGTLNGSITPLAADFISIYANLAAFPALGDPEKIYKASDTGLYYKWYGSYQVVPVSIEAYNPLECWINGKNPDGSSIDTGVAVAGYMRRIVESGYEAQRILVLPKLPSSGPVHYWMSEKLPVNEKDRFNFSVDRKLDSDHTTGGWHNDSIFKIRLRGNDGSYWSMIGNPNIGRVGSWKLGTGGFPVQHYEWIFEGAAEDEKQWYNHSVTVDPCPVSGNVEIMLFQSGLYGLVNDTHFANIQLEYIPCINGVYQKLTGQYNKVFDTSNRKANHDEQIYISDAEVPNWKGVLWRDLGGGSYERISRVYDYRFGTGGALGLAKFSKYQAFALWNQYNRTIRKFQANFFGLDTDVTEIPTMIHKYWFTDSSEATDNKYYQLLNFDMDLATCQWSGTFADVWDSSAGKDYSSTHEFKYLTK